MILDLMVAVLREHALCVANTCCRTVKEIGFQHINVVRARRIEMKPRLVTPQDLIPSDKIPQNWKKINMCGKVDKKQLDRLIAHMVDIM